MSIDEPRSSHDERAARRELAAAKQRLDAQIDNSPLAIVEFDRDHRITRWSAEAERVFGWSASEVLGKAMYDIPWIYQDDLDIVGEEDERLRTGTGRSVNVNRNVRKDGSVIWCEWYDSAIYDENGEMVSIFSQVLDVTERKAAEAALRESEEKYRGLFTNLIDGFALHEIVLDDAGRPADYVFLEVNHAFEELLALRADDIIGKRATEVLPGIENDPADWIGVYGRVALTGEPAKFEQHSEVLGKWYSVSAYSPRPGRFVTVFEDITARKMAEDALAQSESRVRHKLESLLSPEGDIGELELSEILDVPAVQSLMEEFHEVTHIPMALIDLGGHVSVGVGWQDVCTKFHRVNPESCAHCIESDTVLTKGIRLGEVRVYECENGLRDVATPILVGGKHVGNLFTGQFFFDDETVDYERFREQARRYGFDEEAYVAALDAVPRLSHTQLETGMRFLMKLSNMISQLSFRNIQLARSVSERQRLADQTLRQAEVLNAINTVFHEALTAETMEDLGRVCLDTARTLTGSEMGFITELGADGMLHDFAIDDPGWDACAMTDATGHRAGPRDFELHGLYGEVELSARTVLTNDPSSHPSSLGTPEGHPALSAFLGVPLIDSGTVVGMVGVANRPGGYAAEQQEALETLAPAIVEAVQRKRAENALRESRRRVDQLARMLDASSQPFAIANEDGELLDFNPAYEQLTGYSADELSRISWRTALTAPEWRDADARSIREQAESGGAPIRYEKEYVRKDGTRVPVEVLRNVHKDERGGIDFYYAFFTDLTERKRNEAALARTAERLALLADSARMLLATESPESVVQTIAERVMAFLGCQTFFNYMIEDGAGMRLNAYAGVPDDAVEGIRKLEFGDAVCGCVAEQGERIVACDVQNRPDRQTELIRSFGIQAYACHPLVYQGDTIGTLSFGCRTRPSFTDEELDLMRVVADQAATAMARKRAEDRLRASREQTEAERLRLRTIIDEMPLGVTLSDERGATLEANVAATAIWGSELQDVEGPRDYAAFKVFERGTGRKFEAADWPLARTLESRRVESSIGDYEGRDGRCGTVRLTSVPILDALGRLNGAIVLTEDVTDELERQRLSEALNDIGATISATLDFDEILERLLAKASTAVRAETSAIMLREHDHWVLHAECGLPASSTGRLFHDDDAPDALLAETAAVPVAVDDVKTDPRVDEEVVEAAGIRSFLSIPLIAQGRVLGTLAFHHRAAAVAFTEAQLDFARKLQSVVTLALENAKLYERERRIADTLQEAVLAPLPKVEGLDSAYLYRPASATANVGGDFYDLFELEGGKVAIVVGDVSGKGLEAARLTSLLRDGIRAYALETDNPARALERVNELVRRSSPVDSFATVFLGVLDPDTGWMRYTAAGHPPALLCGSEVEYLPETPASIVGAFNAAKFGFGEAQLEPGEVLVLYTDGVLEARRGAELFGEERLLAAMDAVRGEPLKRMPEAIVRAVLEFAGGHLRDDTVVMCVRWNGPSETS